MIKIKNFLLLVITIGVIVGLFYLKDKILEGLVDYFEEEPKIVIAEGNDYAKSDNFLFVQQDDDYVPNNYNDLINIFYSVLNQGWMEFTFYCPIATYTNCLDDVSKLSNDKILLSDINNYVHPYNSYSSIRTVFDDTGEVTIFVNRLYSLTEVIKLNEDIDELMKSLLNDTMTLRDKIKTLHDYIVSTTTYDSDRADHGTSEYDSARMLGPLYEKYATCSGYTDLMAVMLSKLGVKNYKVASDTHIWNAVYIDNTWLHLDLTWDDPISVFAENSVDYTFFLVSTEQLLASDTKTTDHTFNQGRYLELKQGA